MDIEKFRKFYRKISRALLVKTFSINFSKSIFSIKFSVKKKGREKFIENVF